MKPIHFCLAVALASTPLPCLTASGQTHVGHAAPGAANASPGPQVGEDAKEKAEDAALLQQLETGTQKATTETRVRNQFNPDKGPRGPVGVNMTPMPRFKNVMTRQAGGVRSLVVLTTAQEPKDQAALEEDLAIMSRVLAKAAEEAPGRPGNPGKFMGIDVFFTPGGSQMRSLYIENYGALFFLNVNFPLIAPPEKRTEGKPTADSAWEDARQELYGQRSQELVGEPAEEYSEEKVDKLKETLLEALKNASNMRGLKPTDFVTLWISGAGATGGSFRVMRAGKPGNQVETGVTIDQFGVPSKRTALTIRVTKEQIDAFAHGKLNAEAFQKKAQMTAYMGDAGSPGGDNLIFDGGGRAKF
jgi:hypothetical protein